MRHDAAIYSLRERSRHTLAWPAISLSDVQVTARDRVLSAYESGDYATQDGVCLCGGTSGITVVDQDRYGLPAPSVLCGTCGVIFASPRLDGRSLEKFYATDYRQLYVGADAAPDRFFHQQIQAGTRVLRYVRDRLPQHASVVDIGCGAGGMLVPFRDANHDVVGCDIGSQYLERGRAEGLDLRDGPACVLEDRAPIDLAIISHVLEHVADVRVFLDEVRALMAPSGVMYVELPGIRRVSVNYGDPLRSFQNAHLWNFDLSTLAAVLSQQGWRLVKGSEEIRSLFTPAARSQHVSRSFEANLSAIGRAERYRSVGQLAFSLRSQKWFPTRRRLEIAADRVQSRLSVTNHSPNG